MAEMTGVVQAVSTKDVTTKFGVKPTFSFKIDSGWVKCGFKNPMVNSGDTVTFDGEHGTYGLEGKNIRITEKGAPGATVTVNAPSIKGSTYSGGSSSRVFPIPALHGDRSIVRQNALARATELLIASKGGKAFEIDDTNAAVAIHLARKFEAYTAGDLDMAEAMEENAAAAKAA